MRKVEIKDDMVIEVLIATAVVEGEEFTFEYSISEECFLKMNDILIEPQLSYFKLNGFISVMDDIEKQIKELIKEEY